MQASCASPDLHEMEDTPFALKIPEILQHIFELSDEKSNCNSNVLVCKAWSDPCMNAIWREVNDLYRLVKLLGPTSVSYSSIEFVTNNEPLDWTRFYFYARRVRRVVYPGVTRKSLRDVFEDISFHRSSNPLLPNLKILDLNSLSVSSRSYMKNFCFMFMEPTLEEYHLRLESVSSAAGLSLNLQTVANKCPHLNLVDISLPHADNDMADVVLDFIKKTPNVSSISLSPFHQMIPFTSVLQNFPYLKRLIIGGHRVHETVADTPCIKSLALTSPTGGGYFVSLTTLSVVAPYSMAEEFLTNTLRLLNRISISSDLRKPETPSSVKHLLERLVEKCPRMETLHLSYSFVTEKNYSRFPAPGCIVQVAHLRPILSYSAMKSFKFEHPFPVTLADKFAEEIASSWPHLQQLSLGHTPVLRRRDFKNCFTLRALLSFARHCRISNISLSSSLPNHPHAQHQRISCFSQNRYFPDFGRWM
ncbi:hypothetical protein BT96DRAFT_971605 [Gymnopus androsaceus JB14]|uniref:F-box domain-containing protein n=1 Tax=Gymnopus androsaceus JB14 TaxID=1447944 RepID=A0A6A4I806_9AGAR|nr:hypothetical protein BT96DRAFT_971605 [Gymnopus androsaceus JB14]